MHLRKAITAVLLGLCVVTPARASESDELIWPRIVAGMRLVDDEQPQVRRWAAEYARHPHSFRRLLSRSEPFLWYIVEAAEQRGLPMELVLLPAVESGFDPHARSEQKAQGLWQFMPWTGQALGLQNTRHYDARRDLVPSTDAALGYLQDLHRRFGDWHLALAAYNIGSARLANLTRDQSDAPDFWSIKLPRETYEHVRRLMGIALLVEKPEEFGVQLPAIGNRRAAELVALDHPVNLHRAAARAGIDEALIRAYNPGLKTMTNTTGKKTVMLPAAEAARLRHTLSLARYAPEPIRTVVVHVVRPGDSLWHIAQRYDVKVNDLTRHNGLKEGAVIRPGRKLEVPIQS